ncbi:MAG: phosphoribosylaminoimidazolesuccinocarboxamide synthase [Thiotrichales bacterium]|jgi:phosphoribosylaminoimidazole-succinocarboxamide synthase|nr:phosphoribosylaminoimidazolesuccinocarboxamide synthase [Thiotrichales bacterium]
MNALHESNLSRFNRIHQGKVRDIYDLDAQHLLIVTTDRVSAFDVVMPTPIPSKGELLSRMTRFWMNKTRHIIPNQLTNIQPSDVLNADELAVVGDRVMIVRKFKPLPVEAIVRGYLVGSGWKDYQQTGQVCGHPLPAGLKQAQKLPQAIFTPSTKAAVGDHDENISRAQLVAIMGEDKTAQVEQLALSIYQFAADYALERGIIIADTKFEFGEDENGVIHLIDEVLTPDSSRFWPANQYVVGTNPPSFDKQYIRDYLETLDWAKKAPGPTLPAEVVQNTLTKYQEAERLLTA